jgi:hypothetical protein
MEDCRKALRADRLDSSMRANAIEELESYMRWNQSRWRDQRIIKTWGVLCGRPETRRGTSNEEGS